MSAGAGGRFSQPLLIALSNPSSPAVEAEFDEWYDSVHVPEVLDLPGFRTAVRLRASDRQVGEAPIRYRYLALYELEHARSAVEALRAAAGRLHYSDAIAGDRLLTIYEPFERPDSRARHGG